MRREKKGRASGIEFIAGLCRPNFSPSSSFRSYTAIERFADGMPIAIQLVGRPYTENTLLTIGRDFQARTDWHRRRPPLNTIANT